MKISFNLNGFNNSNNHDPNKNKPPKIATIFLIIGFITFFAGIIINFITFGSFTGRGIPVGFIVSGIGFAMIFIGIIITSVSNMKNIKDIALSQLDISNDDDNNNQTEQNTTGYEVFRCPSCGAVVDHNAKECAYCGSDLREKND